MKVLILGLDGATWDLIKPWAEQGYLPTFKRLIKEGVFGELESTIPPWTIPAWNSLGTGKNPGKLGVFTFMSRVKGTYEFKPYFLLRKREQYVWDILSDKGKKVTLINIPNIHSAYKINGYLIAGWLCQSEGALTWPSNLKEKINKISGIYEVDIMEVDMHKGEVIKHPLTENEYVKGIYRIMDKRFKVLEFFLKKEWDFLFVVITAPDRVQHRFWQNKRILLGCYRKIDIMLEMLLQTVGRDTILFLVSDHGFGPRKRIFNINEWFIKEGYLKLKRKRNPKLLIIGNILRKTKLSLFIKPLISLFSTELSMKLKTATRPYGIEEANVDWKQTRAFAYSSSGDIYINLKGRDIEGTVSPKDYDRLRDEIISKLGKLIDPKTGQRIPVQVYKGEEIYKGKKKDITPDLIIQVDENIHGIVSKIGSGKIFLEGGERWGGTHRIKGIFIAYGPDIKRGIKIENARIYDIASTVLHIFNLPISRDVDGRVLTEIFEKESELAKRVTKYVKPLEAEKQRIREKIKKLRKAGKI